MKTTTLTLTEDELRAVANGIAATLRLGDLRSRLDAKLDKALDAFVTDDDAPPFGEVVCTLPCGARMVRLTGRQANRAAINHGVDYRDYRRFYAFWSGGEWHSTTQGVGSTKFLTGGGTQKGALVSWDKWGQQ